MLLRMTQNRQGGGLDRGKLTVIALAVLFAVLAILRPVDHDESQYVAAAMLAKNALPYRDFAYFQTPLQPLLFGPLAGVFGILAWPGLRMINALLSVATVAMVERGARVAGASREIALGTAALFACTDILLFSAGVARNDALPAAMLAGAVWLAVEATRGEGTRGRSILAGFLFAAAAATKISYALPALVYFGWALLDRRHRPAMIALGAAPIVLLVAWLAAQAPEAFRFEVFTFPSIGPDQYYRDAGRLAKLSIGGKAIDTLKFLALGTALPAIVAVAARWRRVEPGPARLLELLALAGLVAALLPEPTWRQYLLPVLPPLFVRLALAWQARPPLRWERIAFVTFACAGLAPSIESVVLAVQKGAPMSNAITDGAMIAGVMDKANIVGPVATLNPQYLPATGRMPDPRFAAGPFYFRSHGLLDPASERAINLLSADNLGSATLPQAVLVGGESLTDSGDPAVEKKLQEAAAKGAVGITRLNGGRFTLYVLR
jgi:4-amino-4-deoxy-L-arabinose transferase-like glycosyltransferase